MAENRGNLSQPKDYQLIVEKDVRIPLRDGTVLFADVFHRAFAQKTWTSG